jgi:hypothetical protein
VALLTRFSRKSVQIEMVRAATDPLAAFASEAALAAGAEHDREPDAPAGGVLSMLRGGAFGAALLWIAVVVVSAGSGAAAMWAYALVPGTPDAASPPAAQRAVAALPPAVALAPPEIEAPAVHEHPVVVHLQDGTTLRRTVVVKAGEEASLEIAPGAPAAAPMRAGWVAFAAPIALELRENGRVIGTTAAERLMLPAGDHQVELINEPLGYRTTRRVSIAADRTVSIPVEMPTGTVSINALPWAEVWMGGERIGETPIANLSRPIGAHDVILRHPQFGERRARLTVSLKQPARLGVDMRTP